MHRLSLAQDRNVAIVRFDNPPHGYMDAPMVEALDKVTRELVADDAVRAIVFTGALEGVFIQHYDVAELSQLGKGLRQRGLKFTEARLAPERTLTSSGSAASPSLRPIVASSLAT